jgi:hypothetical protein
VEIEAFHGQRQHFYFSRQATTALLTNLRPVKNIFDDRPRELGIE